MFRMRGVCTGMLACAVVALGCGGIAIVDEERAAVAGAAGASAGGGGAGGAALVPSDAGAATADQSECSEGCDDGNDCTEDTCPSLGCQHVPLPVPGPCTMPDGSAGVCHGAVCEPESDSACGDCDDGNECTDDACGAGECHHASVTYHKSCTASGEPGSCFASLCVPSCETAPDGSPCVAPDGSFTGVCEATECVAADP